MTQANVDTQIRHHKASLGHKELTGYVFCYSAPLIWYVIRMTVHMLSIEPSFYWHWINIFPALLLHFCSGNSCILIYLTPLVAWRPALFRWVFSEFCVMLDSFGLPVSKKFKWLKLVISNHYPENLSDISLNSLAFWALSQYKDRLIYVWWFPC